MDTLSRQWIRNVSLTADGAIDLSAMRIKFNIRYYTTNEPTTAEIRVYNLKKDTAQKFIKMEYQNIRLAVGYQGALGDIFNGTIVYVRMGRETPTETYLDLYAQGSDVAHNEAYVNKTLKKGSTGSDAFDAIAKSFKEYGVKIGYKPEDLLKKLVFNRPYTLYGAAKDLMRDLARSTGSSWNISNKELVMLPNNSKGLEGGIRKVNSRSGMIGMPIQSTNGIIVRMLIDPSIKVNSQIQVDEGSIQRAEVNLTYGGAPLNDVPFLPSIASDGIYRVVAIDYNGDTRGIPWYQDLYVFTPGEIGDSQVRKGRS